MKKLIVLCPQQYDGAGFMQVTPCLRCKVGWDAKTKKCLVETGAEHLPLAPPPTCPLQDRCQHQLQSVEPCAVRARGLICESALIWSGLSEADAMDHPLSFNADTTASPEELQEREELHGSEEDREAV